MLEDFFYNRVPAIPRLSANVTYRPAERTLTLFDGFFRLIPLRKNPSSFAISAVLDFQVFSAISAVLDFQVFSANFAISAV